jgi:hypothetical protein
MGERGMADDRPTRHQGLDLILRLHGPQDVAVAVHHRGTPQAVVAVRIGQALIYFHDWAGAAVFARRLQQFSHDGSRLPAVTAPPTALLVRQDRMQAATVVDVRGVVPVIGALRHVAGEEKRLDVIFGRLGLLIHDRGAYASTRAAFREAERLCSIVMPPERRPTLRAAAMDRAAAALTPPPRGRGRPSSTPDRTPPTPRRPPTAGRWME